MEDEILSDECVEDEVTNAPVSLTMFIPGTVYNCSVSASTVAGEGPPAELLVQTLQDGRCTFTLLLGILYWKMDDSVCLTHKE